MSEKRLTPERLAEIEAARALEERHGWGDGPAQLAIDALAAEIRAAWSERDAARGQVAQLRDRVAELREYLTRIDCLLPRTCPGPDAGYDARVTCIRCGALRATAEGT
jgi:hypothetical protein